MKEAKMSNLKERDVPQKLVEDVLGTCDVYTLQHPRQPNCFNWQPIAQHDPAEDHRQWWLSQMPRENDSSEAFKISEAAWIVSAEAAQKALATQK